MKQVIDTIKLLRFPFSIFLLPVTLFAIVLTHASLNLDLFLILLIWHVLVFPASNGYNSYNDQDKGPIGGLEFPPQPTKTLLHTVNLMDFAAIVLSSMVGLLFMFFVMVYITASRLYSNRVIRLKKYPIVGFLVVFFFQGAWVFAADIISFRSTSRLPTEAAWLAAAASSCLIGAVYPLTQIYQHESDREDNVTTLSMMLGIRGTFIFTGLLFFIASLLIYSSFSASGQWLMFNIIMLPTVVFFLTWMVRSFRQATAANFKNTMIMLLLSSVSVNAFFIILLIK